MILLPGEGAEIFNECVQDIVEDRGKTIDLNDALTYAEREVVKALLTGRSQVILDLDHVVQMDRAQPEVKALFKEHSQNVFWDKCLDVIDDLFPDIK
ncbi:transcriptional regulator [Parasutterella excrementihominis]|uniref:transcriptional regulator n=1 Tax=Parasutterella excrementihominis TaxID=487175 RepID=UPI00351F8255